MIKVLSKVCQGMFIILIINFRKGKDMTKVKCKNTECKFNNFNGKCTKNNIEVSYKGCKSFERNIIYYVRLVWEELDKTNMIFPFKLTPELRIGMFYVMELYGLQFVSNTWGHDSFITLHKDGVKDGNALDYKDIISIGIDMKKLNYHMEKFNQGILPPYDEDKKESKVTEQIKPKVEYQPFGWLSPTGEFIKGDWGEHEGIAIEIVKQKHLESDYNEWRMKDDGHILYRDYLINVKGYALIHNPSMYGNYIVTHTKELTKRQKDFLYGYFIDMGDAWSAERYLND